MLSLLKKREPSDRSRLLAAFEARDRARRTLDEVQAKYSRLEEVSHAGDVASRDASNALRAATEARQSWVRAGCPFTGHAEVQRLDGEAAAAGAGAERALLDTKAVREELRRAEGAVQSAQSVIKDCENQIDEAIGLIQLEQFQEVFAEFRRISDRRHQLHLEIRGFLEGASSGAGARQVRQVLEDCAVQTIPDFASTLQGTHVSSPPAEVLQRGREWRKRAAELREDPLC
jgi:hypothetical protein